MTKCPATTNNAGIPVESDEHSPTLGLRDDGFGRPGTLQIGDRIAAAAKAA